MSTPPPVTRLPWFLLAATCFATFAATSSGSTRAPFLLEMAGDLEVDLALVANLFGLTSVSWGVTSFLAGAGADRWGSRPFMIGGPAALALAMTALAMSDGFLGVAIWAVIGGGCCGVFTGVSMAEVSLRVPDAWRGRALGWVMSGQSLTLLIGVPLAAWIGASVGWRGVHFGVAGLALAAAFGIFLAMRPGPERPLAPARPRAKAPGLRKALSGPIILLLGSVVAERVCFGLAAVYYATFLQLTHDLTIDRVALPLGIFALGNIGGTLIGGRLGDKFRDRRRTFAVTMLSAGGVAVVLFGWHPSLTVTVALGFVYAFANALARPPLMAALADVPAAVRGTVMGLNSTVASIGWLAAASLGGWMVTGIGFSGFGALTAALAVVGAALALAGRPAKSDP